jgi:hypothetical protein
MPRYGAEGFVPTPEQPLGWRADGNGYYPGATPPTEWREGAPVQRDGQVRGKHSGKPEAAKGKIWDFADTRSKNIRWKSPLPGWSLSHPIVVGNPSAGSRLRGDASARQAGQGKVFAVGEPDFVICYDADTGKVLWQRRIMLLLCDGLPEAKAVAGQKALDLARAIFHTSGGGASTCGRNSGNVLAYGKGGDNPSSFSPEETFARRWEFAAKLVAMLERFRPDVEAFGDADLLVRSLAGLGQQVPWTSAYLKDFDPYDLSGCYKECQIFFAMMSGPAPHGSRLYIQSSAYLSCIGAK